MSEEKDLVKSDGTGLGAIKIADEVVSIIAGLAATEIDGIAGMSGGVVGGIAEMLGRKNFSKGVKVEVGEREAAVDLFIIVKYGARNDDRSFRCRSQCSRARRQLPRRRKTGRRNSRPLKHEDLFLSGGEKVLWG